MDEALYLHEVIDITGRNTAPYMEHTAGFKAEEAAGRGLTLFGTWEVVGATGRWPQVVNLWEMVDGWEGWERLVRTTNLEKATNTALAQWWDQALQWRSGGFDRLCVAAAGSPTLAELTAAGVVGEVFVHEIATVRPGAAGDYVDAVTEVRAPLLEERGHRLVGLYEVMMTEAEVISVWATTLESHVELQRATAERDTPLAMWRARATASLVRSREELMVPYPGTPLAPRV